MPDITLPTPDSSPGSGDGTPGPQYAQMINDSIQVLDTAFSDYAAVARGGSDPNFPRPDVDGAVIWIMSVIPNNSVPGDVYFRVSGTPEPSGEPNFQLPGLMSLYRASDVPATVGSAITAWSDSVGTVTLSGNATLRSDLQGRRYVQFNGTSDHLSNASVTTARPYQMVVVGRIAGSSVNKTLIGGTSTTARNILSTGSANFQIYAGTILSSTVPADTVTHYFRTVFGTSTNGTIQVDGASTSGTIGAETVTGRRFGANSGLTTFTNLEIFAVAYYDSTTDLSALRSEIIAYYGTPA